MKTQSDLLAAVNGGRLATTAEFRSGSVFDRSGTSDGRAWRRSGATYNVEMGGRPMVFEVVMAKEDQDKAKLIVFPAKGSLVMIEVSLAGAKSKEGAEIKGAFRVTSTVTPFTPGPAVKAA